MNAEGTVSVVMVTYHTGPALWLAIHAALQQNPSELIIVNNGNPKKTMERLVILSKQHAKLKLITGHGNVGFARACNLGVASATGKYVLLLNPDCILPADALSAFIQAFEQNTDATMLGACIVDPEGREQRGSRRNLLTPETAMVEGLALYRFAHDIIRFNLHHTPLPTQTTPIPAISGACMFLQREDYQGMGGLDEKYFLHVEDLDLCLRIARDKGKIYFLPHIKIMHFGSTSHVSGMRVEGYKLKSFIRYFYKNFRVDYHPLALLALSAAMIGRFFLKLLLGPLIGLFSRKSEKSRRAACRLLLLQRHMQEENKDQVFAGRTVLVTGATSHIGLAVIGDVIAAGGNVIAISRQSSPPLDHPRLEWICCDMEKGLSPLKGHSADLHIHAAPLWLLPTLIPSLAELLDVSRIVAFGSTSIFTKTNSANRYEQKIVSQLRDAESAIEIACREAHIKWTILRPTMIYGAGLDANVTRAAAFIRRWGFYPVYPPANGQRQPVHGDDLAALALGISGIKISHSKSYNVGGGEMLDYREMITRIAVALEKKPRIVKVPQLPWLLNAVGFLTRRPQITGEMARRMNEDLVVSNQEAQEELNYQPRSFLTNGILDLGMA